jgi:hypothetical protein
MAKEFNLTNNENKTNIETKPFVRKNLDEDKEETGYEVIAIRINKEEREIINWIKDSLNYTADSKAIKTAMIIGKNVLQTAIGQGLLFNLTKENRYRTKNTSKNKENTSENSVSL